jgi:Xaa-Pro aminopeptidase
MNRITALRHAFAAKRLQGFIVSSLTHIRYLTNFSGSSAVLIVLPDALHFFTDGRYAEQVKSELYSIEGLHTHITREPWKYIGEQKLLYGAQRLGFEAQRVSFAAVQSMRKHLKPVRLAPCKNILEPILMPKTAAEVAHIKSAADIAAQVYEYVLNFVKPGQRENEVAAEISYQARKLGSEADAFDIIVASGVRGALPHGRASEKVLQRGELITLDFGCRVQGFHSDLTRTFALGKPKDFDVRIYNLVLEANRRAIAKARAGITCKKLDGVAREIITKAGFGEQFEHSLGHGLGLDVHESPTVSQRFPRMRIPAGAVITIEPGVYVPECCGVRIEDDVWVREDGCEVLTTAPKDLVVV